MRVASRAFAFVIAALFSGACTAAEDQGTTVQGWLEKMSRAAHMLNYEGTFVYSYGDQFQAMRIIRSTDETGERERLVSLSGPPREVLRDNNLVTCILSDDRSVVVERARAATQFPPAFPVGIKKLGQYYSFGLGRTERIAGQLAQKIVIRPRDAYRYGYQLWVDRQTGLLLKSDLMDESERSVERFMFTEVTYLDKVPEDMLRPGISGREYTWFEAEERVAGATAEAPKAWDVMHVPAGFILDVHRVDKMATSRRPMEHLVYTDGLASVSVFIEANGDEESEPLVGSSRMGAVSAYGKALNGHHITVVGEVPFATVKMIGESIRPRTEND